MAKYGHMNTERLWDIYSVSNFRTDGYISLKTLSVMISVQIEHDSSSPYWKINNMMAF
jgi:hypothetical protein